MTTASLSSLRELKLGGMASAYEAILATSLDQHPDVHKLIARLVDAEGQNRQRRGMEVNLRLSKLRYAVTLQDVDCAATRTSPNSNSPCSGMSPGSVAVKMFLLLTRPDAASPTGLRARK